MAETMAKDQLRKAFKKRGYYWLLYTGYFEGDQRSGVCKMSPYEDDRLDQEMIDNDSAFLTKKAALNALKKIKQVLKHSKKD